jgi:hypothetical protein
MREESGRYIPTSAVFVTEESGRYIPTSAVFVTEEAGDLNRRER